MAPPRVRESCIPCRQRKSRCNAETPCSSCVLRGTEGECQLPSGSRPQVTRRSASPKPRVIDAPTKEEKQLWARMMETLPSRSACEILLEHLYLECDWLYHHGDLIGTWHRVIQRGGIDPSTAGLLYATLAISCQFLGDKGSMLYRPNVPHTDHHRLFILAQAYLPSPPKTMVDLDLYTAVMNYSIFAGVGMAPATYLVPAAKAAVALGIFDENAPEWNTLDNEARNTRRRIGWSIIAVHRWSRIFGGENPLGEVRMNLCRPNMAASHLTSPISLPLPARASDGEASFRIIRVRSVDELERVARYRHTIVDMAALVPRVKAFTERTGQVDAEVLLGECELIYRDVLHFREVTLVSADFSVPPVGSIDPTDIVSCRRACQGLIMHLGTAHIAANLLRYWLEIGDIHESSPSLQKRLYAACLDNARQSMDAIPAVKVVVASRQGPFVVPFIAANLFNSATSFAIPVLRSVRYWTTKDAASDIAALPAWPESMDPRNRPPLHDSVGRLPPGIYTDATVKECATNILFILDTLTELNANPLGQMAENRLAALISQYGLRDAANVPFNVPYDPAMGMVHQTVPAQDVPVEPSVLDVNDDFAFLNSLLQMDGSVWEGLLEAGALTRTDGKEIV